MLFQSSRDCKRPEVEILPLIDAETLRRCKRTSTSSRRSHDSSRYSTSGSSRHRSNSSRSSYSSSSDRQSCPRVRKVTYKDSDGNMTREVRINSKGEAEVTYGSSKGSGSTSSASSSGAQPSGEENKWIEYKHKGTSRERIIRMTYSFPDGSLKILDYE